MHRMSRRRAVLVLCARQPEDEDLEGLKEVRAIQETLAQHRQRNPLAEIDYELRICTSVEEVRDYVRRIRAPIDLDDDEADEPSLPIAVVHVITHANAKSSTFYLDEDVKWSELATLFGAGDVCPEGVHYWMACCNGWQRKGSHLVDAAKNATLPQSLLAWTIPSENEPNISVTRIYYDELLREATSDLAHRVLQRASSSTVVAGLKAWPVPTQ